MHVCLEKNLNNAYIYIVMYEPLTQVVENLYIGSYRDLQMDTIDDYGVDVVINVAKECQYTPPRNNITYYHYLFDDNPEENISEKFDEIADIIKNNIEQPNGCTTINYKIISVHCMAGKSRSASFILAYLIKYEGMSLKEAYRMLNTKRNIYPNMGFMRQLMDYELKVSGKSSIDYDEICIEFIFDTIGFCPKHLIKETYFSCDKNIDKTVKSISNEIALLAKTLNS